MNGEKKEGSTGNEWGEERRIQKKDPLGMNGEKKEGSTGNERRIHWE